MSTNLDKAKLVNAIDKAMADNKKPTHTIELFFVKSPKKGEKCGAIVLIKMREIEGIDWKQENVDPVAVLHAQNELNQMTQEMVGDPEKFKESDGKWIPFAIKRFWELFDKLDQNADLAIKAPQLKIKEKIPRNDVIAKRHMPQELFKTAFMIDLLLNEFQYDPWRRIIRRGRIGAKE